MKNLRIMIKDIQLDELHEHLKNMTYYCTALMALLENENGKETKLIGSGTLINAGSHHGILTAYHVANSNFFRECDLIGISIRNDFHCFSIERQCLNLLNVGIPKSNSTGPDLSVIILPENKIGTMKTTKNFWNLATKRNYRLSSDILTEESLWVVFGCPDIYTEIIDNKREQLNPKAIGGISGIETKWVEGGFDYCKLSVSYDDSGDAPEDFGGVSGGGLWQITVKKGNKGNLIFGDPFLSGVAFYQTEIVNKKRSIMCHGKKSIYEHVYKALLSI